MPKTAEDILNQITMINNINNTNNNNYTSIVSEENDEEEMTTSSCRGLASLSASQKPFEVAFMPPGKLPAAWRGVKIDLFANPALKLKFTIIRADLTQFGCVAGLNSPSSYVFRGRDQGQGTDEFWSAVQAVIDRHRHKDQFRISKASKPRKGQTIDNMAMAVYLDSAVYHCDLIYDDAVYHYRLTGTVTEKFKNSNGIATTYIGGAIARSWASKEELGI